MVSNDLMRIKQSIQTTLRIGKKGVSLGIIQEIMNQLKSRGIIKIKLLKNFIEEYNLDTKLVAEEIAKRTGSMILEIRGRTIILYLQNADRYKPKFKEVKY